MTRILISAGDVSGDQQAAALVRELRRRRPDWKIYGLGGEALASSGVDLIGDQSDLAVGGLFELVGQVGRVRRAWMAVQKALVEIDPELVILVDSGGFNLPLARQVRKKTRARTLYFIAPQIWAWRPGRLKRMVQRVDRVAVIFPFEKAAYSGSSLPVDFVGHPLAEELGTWRLGCDHDEACRRLGLDPTRRWVALLPGSRRNEVARHLPLMLASARRIADDCPELGFLLALAPSIDRGQVEQVLERSRALGEAPAKLSIHGGASREVIRASCLVLLKPGTGTVESMLLQRPMVVVGRAHPLTAALVRRLLKVRWLSMPNLIAERSIVPELLQGDATSRRVAAEASALLNDEAESRQIRDLAKAEQRLGPPGAIRRVADLAESMIVSDSK
ncbi:MAG: lipid-A-disaccharide synthase [bacterium TMED88]|nr:lipid-A-disaccharide synthase [Deltaproteobacteria bacterium]OUV35708.1 MAG: lipid-A-disaccharide synthase [bacterium TMED88]